MLKIVIGTDHRGFDHKNVIQNAVSIDMQPIEWIDVGCFSKERTDYPHYAFDVVQMIKNKKADIGILLCGTGVGMAIAANRFEGMRAGVAWDAITAQRCKEEDNVNILTLPADFITPEQAVQLVLIWLNAQFKGGRYQQRIEMIDKWSGL
ncbi:ribose 5-phosphate isomerase B [soil metagenome]